jgi:hypothetical protein
MTLPIAPSPAPDHFKFKDSIGAPGTFLSPSSAMGANYPCRAPYNDPVTAVQYAVIKPHLADDGSWDLSELPNELVAVRDGILKDRDLYLSNWCGAATGQTSDQQLVAATIASLRDYLLTNFTSPNLAKSPLNQDYRIANELVEFWLGLHPMMKIIANAHNNVNQPGFKIQCTETAPFLTFMLNGTGVIAREWDVVFRGDMNPGNQNTDPAPSPGYAPSHGTVEYYDRQWKKWVFIDLNHWGDPPALPGWH